jgi:HSP20 family protein
MLPVISKKSYMPSLVDQFFKDDLFDNVFGWNRSVTVPSVNIAEGANSYRIEVAAPGLNRDDFKVDVEDHQLIISSRKEEKKEEKEDKFLRREFSYSSFSRSFILPEWVEEDKIKATHKDGILSVEIPKKDEVKTKMSRNIKIS